MKPFFLTLTLSTIAFTASGQEMTFAVPNDVGRAEFNPTNSVSAQERFLFHLIYEPLLRLQSDLTLGPALAKSWSVSNDKITFQLAEGHRFSDGSPVDAKAVRDSFLFLCSEGSNATTDLVGLKGCNSGKVGQYIKTIGKDKIELTTESMPTMFLHQLATSRALVVKQTEKGLAGSGPYAIASMDAATVKFAKNPHYHRLTDVKNNGFVITKIDEKMIESMLKKAEVTGAIMYLEDTLRGLKVDRYRHKADKPFITQSLIFNNQDKVFQHQKLRRALAAAIYRSPELQKCYAPNTRAFGIVPIGLGGSIGHTAPKSVPEIPPEEVIAAVPLLKERQKVTIHQHAGRKKTCLESSLKRIFAFYNIDLTIQYHDSYGTLWPLYLNKQHQGFIELLTFKNREAYSILQFFAPDSTENFANIEDQALLDTLKDARQAAINRRRFQEYRKANQHIHDKAYVVPLYYTGHGLFLDQCIVEPKEEVNFNPFQFLLDVEWDQNCLQKRK